MPEPIQVTDAARILTLTRRLGEAINEAVLWEAAWRTLNAQTEKKPCEP